MRTRRFATIVPCLAVLAMSTLTATPLPFYRGVTLGDSLLDVRVADALRRADGRWLTFGSRVSSVDGGRETPFLVLREADGSHVRAAELLVDSALSYRALSLASLGFADNIVVLGVEYDISGNRGLSLTRLDANLDVVWSIRLEAPGAVFEWARLEHRGGSSSLLLIGEVRREVDGTLDSGDGFLASVHADATVSDVRTLGVTSNHERIVDARSVAADGSMLLLVEIARPAPAPIITESADAVVLLDAAGLVADTRVIGHAVAPIVRARALHLLPHADGGWVIAGRRTAVGPNVFYLHKIGADLAAAPARVLIPFFNIIDVDTRDGAFWLYGEANGENFDTGTVLMQFDGTLQMTKQRRYGTENHVFPTGALEFSPSGALLALGARRSGDAVFVYESEHHVALPSGEGVLCEEGNYAGFSPILDSPTMLTGWEPSIAELNVSTGLAVATVRELAPAEVELCVATSSPRAAATTLSPATRGCETRE